jgi:hypothetical protein
MADAPDISIVVPVYGSDGTLVPLYERVAASLSQIPARFELIFVDDRGPVDEYTWLDVGLSYLPSDMIAALS